MATYKSRLEDGGIPPISGSQAGVVIKSAIKMEFGTSTLSDGDVIKFGTVPSQHELVDVCLSRMAMHSENGAQVAQIGLIGTDFAVGTSTSGDMDILFTPTVTEWESAQLYNVSASVTAMNSLAGYTTENKTLAMYLETAGTSTVTEGTMYGWMETKPLLSCEDIKRIRGATA